MTKDSVNGLILVVEDESTIAELVRRYLTKAGFGVHVVGDGDSALKAIESLKPSAVVLDIGIPGPDGIEVTQKLRNNGNWIPILLCTARDDEIDRVIGLEMGADDYITKPFSPRELVARVKVAVRRNQRAGNTQVDALKLGDVEVDRASRRVFVAGNEVEFTVTEFDLLEYLMSRPGRVLSREQLLSEVWGYAAFVSGRTVDTHIAQVRAKLGDASFIRTVRGIGYSAEPEREIQ
jgi:DNA-binding response OmpR family regulator